MNNKFIKEEKDDHTSYIKKYPQRKSKDINYYNYNSPYYTPLFGTPDCNYTGKKRGRKKDSEKEEVIKLTKKDGNFVLYFD